MTGLQLIIVVCVFIVTTWEQCPTEVQHLLMASCDGSTRYGPTIYVDFNKFNSPCTCTVTPYFVGELLLSWKEVIIFRCDTQIRLPTGAYLGCPIAASSDIINVQMKQVVQVGAEYKAPSTSGTFYHCLGISQNRGIGGDVHVTCGVTAPSTTTLSTPLSSTLSTSSFSPKVESTSLKDVSLYTDVSSSTPSNDTNPSLNTLLMGSMQDDPKDMTYIIAGSAVGGAVILVCLVAIVVILKTRRSSEKKKNVSQEENTAHTNEVFDNSQELPDNPLYHSSQPTEDSGYKSNQNSQICSQKTDSNVKIDSDYDIPPNNKPVETSESSVAIYAVPKKNNIRIPEGNTGDVYAQVCKPSKNAANEKIRKQNQDGLVYMELEDNKDTMKQSYAKDEIEDTNTVAYAEIKHN